MDSAKYTENILDPHLIPFWHKMCETYGWTKVVEDGAPGHQGYAKLCCQRNNLDSLPWPAQSPDLNLIEALWSDIEQELGELYGRIHDVKVLKQAVRDAWNRITRERLRSLIRSMPDRLRAVIAAGGEATPY